MQRTVILLVLVLLGAPLAGADDKPAPQRPLSLKEAVSAVLKAVEAKDAEALKALSAATQPDPWLVADKLCFQGKHAAADAFAKATSGAGVAKLGAYVTAWRSREPDTDERKALDAMVASLQAGKLKAVEEAAGQVSQTRDTVVRVRIGHVVGVARRAGRKLEASHSALHDAAKGAQTLGWLQRAGLLYGEGGLSAYYRSDWPGALKSWKARYTVELERGSQAKAALVLGNIGLIYYELGDYDQALTAQQRTLAMKIALGDKAQIAATRHNIGDLYKRLGEWDKARAIYQQALEEARAAGDRGGAATTLGNIGLMYENTGEYKKALAIFKEALAEKLAAGDKTGATDLRRNIGIIALRMGDYAKALEAYEQALKEYKAAGNRARIAATLLSIGSVYNARGNYPRALSYFERSIELQKVLGGRLDVARTLLAVGLAYRRLGNYAKALSIQEQALDQFKALRDKRGAAAALSALATVYNRLGDQPKALAMYQQALKVNRALGRKASIASNLANIGMVHSALRENDKALAFYAEALAMMKANGDRVGAARLIGNSAAVYRRLGDYAKALASHQEALKEQEALGYKMGIAISTVNIGHCHEALGDTKAAQQAFEKSARLARRLRAVPVSVTALMSLAFLHLKAGDSARAASRAREARDQLETMVRGLDEEQSAGSRAGYSQLFAAGALASARENDLPEVLTFLESGRAGALLDALDRREGLRWKAESLPPALLRLDEEARQTQKSAQRAYDRALERGDRRKTRSARQALDAATEAVGAVTGRIQRDLKQRAGLFYPHAETIEDVQAALDEDQALVIYGLCVEEVLALVLRRDGQRVVYLGPQDRMAAAHAELKLDEPAGDPSEALATLRKLLVEPLKLDAGVQQVMLSPEGPLCYMPFAALFDQPVALTASATTHVLLLEEEREAGAGILAIGHPDYSGVSDGAKAVYHRGRALAPLPATEREVKTIGSTPLLGAAASEAGLRDALAKQQQWRAVHFACHGLIDAERPMLSSLALSKAGEDDGFLSAREILRMEIPADLVVLSACETGRGKLVKGEGIVGLTRAFMFAGSPRVICSLWKVDDEATQALMLKFYELWHPKQGKGIGAAAALQQAQAFIASQAKWKHPYYWAGWVLWGLPR